MPGGGVTLFPVRGIRIAVDFSWFLVLFLVIFWLSGFYRDVLESRRRRLGPYVLAVASAIGFLRLDPAPRARPRVRGGPQRDRDLRDQLWMFGGVARLERDSDTPATEFKVAIAGPAGHGAIVLVSRAWAGARRRRRVPPGDALRPRGTQTSGVLPSSPGSADQPLVLVFNLLPAFPLDGGRIARAIAWWRTGDRTSATRFAARLGQCFAYLFIGGGFFWIIIGDVFGGIWLA